ncbi:MAG: glycosyltransferase family 2 protein, partial [Coriobacteriales bacterium]
MDISIITPFYKGNHYIQNLGKSLSKAIEKFKIRNNNICFEWVIVNDSPECPIDLSLLPSNFSCRIENHKKNEGIFRARITGLKAAKGKYILFLDQDDEIDSCFFEVMYPLIISGSADVAVCNSYMEDENG